MKGPNCCDQLRGTPPPIVKIPSRFCFNRVSAKYSRSRKGSNRSLGSSSDRKSTRLNSSHVKISYAVFCLKKKSTSSEKCSYLVRLTLDHRTNRRAAEKQK